MSTTAPFQLGLIRRSNLMDKGKGLADELSNEESIDYLGNEEVPNEDNSRDEEVPDEFPNSEDENDVPKSSSTVRGPTKNSGRMRMSGGKLVVRYNGLGVPVGPEATELASFIGLLGRTSILDINQEWRKITPDLKSRLWEFIKERFIVHPNSKKQVFQALGSAFRNFKYLLTTKYILPHKHNRKRLKRPPFQYSHIPQNVWDKFVNSRLSTEFERIRRQQQNKRANNKWNHRLSRKGYAGLLDEICSETGLVETEVDRSVAWKRARKMKNGEYDPDVDSVVKKIDVLEEKAKKGEFKADARNDILARSIGRPATSGHMQGVGKFISPKMYFDTPNNSFQMRQERLNILERLDKQEAELSDLKKKIKKQPRHSDVGSSNFPLDEQTIEDEAEEMTARNEDKSIGMTRNGSPAKKKHETLTKKRQSPRKRNESPKKQVTADCPGDKPETPTKRQSPRKKQESPKQQVMKKRQSPRKKKESPMKPHKKPRMTLDCPRDKPCSPKKKTSPKKPQEKPLSRRRTRNYHIVHMNRVPGLVIFANLCEKKLAQMGYYVPYQLDEEVYKHPTKAHIGLDECQALISMKELGANHMHLYIAMLHAHMANDIVGRPFGFIHTGLVSSAHDKDAFATRVKRAQFIAERLNKANKGQMIFMPYNHGFHWVLIVIDMTTKQAFYLDSTNNDLGDDSDLKDIVTNGISMHVAVTGKKRVKPQITKVLSPNQPGSTECGYYVLRFMKDIIADPSLLLHDFKGKCEYTQSELDEVRLEYASFVSKLIV
ncbi:uncharacterized protein LOC102631357 isoform X2 [Citrus sinensis]|uniref:uncharacterized protein LOC102631357 isoform X2 n=1 Tax=Citrus sinensis TaxID=2711 RepID=UPI00227815AC|nr:uncharacterized protein LOC102631357 isoform X2 [Citrus sinensis]